jgi:hypothetical protein
MLIPQGPDPKCKLKPLFTGSSKGYCSIIEEPPFKYRTALFYFNGYAIIFRSNGYKNIVIELVTSIDTLSYIIGRISIKTLDRNYSTNQDKKEVLLVKLPDGATPASSRTIQLAIAIR